MSVKNTLPKFQNFTNGVMTGTSVLTSAVTSIQNLDNVGLQFSFTGTPTGTFSVEVSVDYSQDDKGNVTNVGHWVALALSPAPAASGAAASIYVDINQISAPWIRAKYTNISGSGTLNGFITAKRLGG
jgi:hypothetical protein